MATDRYEHVRADGGGAFDAFRALPDGGRGPGVLLFHEIFGVNDNMREVAARLAGAGYVVLVPDLFWRIEPRFERNDESALPECMALVERLDRAAVASDITSAFAHLRAMPECSGGVGGVGFCLGGTLAYVFATSSRLDGRGPDAVVSYYGSGIDGMLDRAGSIACPMLFHYGDRDPYIPQAQIAAVEAAVAGNADVTVHRYDAGHAFSNWDAPSMYDQPAADLAWERTLAFFRSRLAPAPTG